MTYTFEYVDEEGDHGETFSDRASAMRAAREEWNLTLESERRNAVDASKGHLFRVVDDSTGRVVHDWADHYTSVGGRYVLPEEVGRYLDTYFQEYPPADVVSGALGNARAAAEQWAKGVYVKGPHAEENTAGLREELGMDVPGIVDTVERWFKQEWIDSTVANARDDMDPLIPSLIMDEGLSIREAQVVALQRLGFRPAETMHILIEITGKDMTLNNVTNSLKSAKDKRTRHARGSKRRGRANRSERCP